MPQTFIHRDRASGKTFSTKLRAAAATALLLLAAGCGGGDREPLAEKETDRNPGQVANVAVDIYIQNELTTQRIPGLALIVQQNDKVIYAKGYGYANLETATGATTEQRFQIGSISKQFLAAAVMLMVEDGKMALDDKIGKYLGTVPVEWDAITVRHLLSHTSGLQRDADEAQGSQPETHGAYTTDQLLTLAKFYKPLTEPGKTYSYSNLGYQLAGVVVEKAGGIPYGQVIQSRIFTPLGMSTARLIEFGKPDATAMGYVLRDKKPVAVDIQGSPAGVQSLIRLAHGGIEMSATDLAKWDASLSTEKILKKSSLAQIWSPNIVAQTGDNYTITYGLGWFMSDYNGHPKVYHSGGMHAFTTDYLRYTNDKLSVIVLTNLGTDSNPEIISRAVANMYVPGILPPK
jgi:D-alanyl-D-alanine carboxypeptidase